MEQLLENGHKVRYYIPFGDQWYAYAIRRFKENPNIALYIVRNFFRK